MRFPRESMRRILPRRGERRARARPPRPRDDHGRRSIQRRRPAVGHTDRRTDGRTHARTHKAAASRVCDAGDRNARPAKQVSTVRTPSIDVGPVLFFSVVFSSVFK